MTEEPTGSPAAPETSPEPAEPALPGTRKIKPHFWSPASKKHKVLWWGVLALMVIGIVTAWLFLAKWHEWRTDQLVVFAIPSIVALGFFILFHFVVRAKTKVYSDWKDNNPDDPEGKDVLVAFNWSSKVLYTYTILLCFINAAVMAMKQKYGIWAPLTPELLGGIWLACFFVNFMVEEYEVNLTALLIIVGFVVATLLWFAYLGWWPEFIRFFRMFGIKIDAAGYVLIGVVFSVAIIYSYIRGAFHYIVITPNYINIQTGVSETGEQIKSGDYTTRIDASDLLERLMKFGKLIVMFRDTRRPPLVFLVDHVGRVAGKLERIQGVLRVDDRDRQVRT